MNNRLCVIGEALIDFIPDRKGQRLKDVSGFKRVAGGAPANVAGAVTKLGISSKMLTKLGADPFGDYIEEVLQEAGIDTAHIRRDSRGETALAFVSLAEDGNRDFKFYRRNSADLLYAPEEIPEDVLDDCGMIHFCSVDLMESPMKEAHRKLVSMALEKGVLVSFDPNLRPSLWGDDEAMKKAVLEFLPLADIVKISDEELEFITGETEIEKALGTLSSGRACCVVYTKGADGAEVYVRPKGSSADQWIRAEAPGFRVEARDTTGAGDSFIGAFLFCILRDRAADPGALSADTLTGYLEFANAYAAYTTTREGALAAMADAKQMEEWLVFCKNM